MIKSMLNVLIFLIAIVSSRAQAQFGSSAATCIWSGTLANCLPTSGIMLRNQRQVRFGEATGNGSNYAAIQAPSSLAGDYTLTLPVDDGTSNQVLTTDGSGGLSWTSPLTNPMDSAGDMIYGGTGGAATKLDSGTLGDWLVSAGAASPTWTSTVTTAKVIDGSADTSQLTVQGHSTQTSDIFTVEKSDGTNVLEVTNVNGTNIRGTTSNNAASTGFVGELVTAIQSTYVNANSTNVWVEIASITITAGDWDLASGITFSTNTGTSVSVIEIAITTTSLAGTSNSAASAGATFAYDNIEYDGPAPSNNIPFAIPKKTASISGSTTYRLSARVTYTGGQPRWAGNLIARRVR